MINWVKEPLVHFLAAGLALYVLYAVVSGPDSEEMDLQRIEVSEDGLLEFLQQQSKQFNPETFRAVLSKMSDADRRTLIDEYVRQEALVREAQKLGLEEKDYVIRRRLIQKMEFLAEDRAEEARLPDEEELLAYYEQNKDLYQEEAAITFTHVFVDPKKHTQDDFDAVVASLGAQLGEEGARFEDAPRYGDRFPFHVNYVDKPMSFVLSHFGPEMTDAVFALNAEDSQWQGPLQSAYGTHFVMITRKKEARQIPFEEVKGKVQADAIRAQRLAAQEAVIKAMVSAYDVEIDADVRGAE